VLYSRSCLRLDHGVLDCSKMPGAGFVFISFASEDRQAAEQLHFALVGAGFATFYDRESLLPSGDYQARLRAAIDQADCLIFLISPDSISSGRYTLTELQYAQRKWPHPKERVLPVMLRRVPWEQLPAYLAAVTVLEPAGNMAAEVTLALEEITAARQKHQQALVSERSMPGKPLWARSYKRTSTIVFLFLQALLLLLAFTAWVPAHFLEPISLCAVIVFVAILLIPRRRT
jgi:hypothetical protein